MLTDSRYAVAVEHGATVDMKFSLLTSSVSLSILVSQAAAWGNVGHQTIGYGPSLFFEYLSTY